jgi:hypothetical protein
MVEASPQSPENDSAWRLRFSLGWTLIALVFVGSASYLWSIHLRYLSIFDSINFAYSLTRFNTFLHMPQPPGYPGFVLIARIFNKVLPTPTSTFFVVGIIASLVTGLFAAKLGEMLSSAKVGIAAAVLIMLNPATFSSIVVSPVRVFLGLVSAAVGCLAWRMWAHPHEKWSFYAAWVTLGIGSSFRPELAAFLFPLVFVASLRQRQSWGALAAALLLFVGCIFLWLIPTARPGGGIVAYFHLLRGFFADQSAAAVEVNSRGGTNPFWHMLLEATVWTFMGVLAWIWALPLLIRRGWSLGRSGIVFFLLWFLPGFLFHCIFHIAAPGHALGTVTTLSVLGGLALGSFRRNWLFIGALIVASVINILLFINPIMWSQGSPEWLEDTNYQTIPGMQELQTEVAGKKAFIIVNVGVFSWRALRYYFPNTRLLLLEPGLAPDCPSCPSYFGPPKASPSAIHGTIPVPACGRLVWDINYGVPDSIESSVDRNVVGPIPIIIAKPGLSFDLPGMHFESRSQGFCPSE